ncbi:hypothetical protein WJ0W_004617 [Paenibacillus melissococcoides]|uniref:Uncharacterized protein n=1 Tax=Paenibacillus melissococcoides TaxID=2912268 RepID=A0ABM9G6Z1_9BACL|nr:MULTISPECIES: hypothetical protein [Paenibacillus]MEB9897689.1 hypothetical protein [Bacillus cereus]CAH8247383.1 hypothetical protein WJ0W_004617 [Paenibacillus melissococcoides]CAH8705307.1 hypothetical protein WDD9_000931 [Paenibacillus melissococcoides]CAH8708528.1 hypothetical protein HTL2_002016 [Paenibacillus melissococcoides]GIO82870.1 hypothetical protein J6TS7_64800 [Paenibacillus dendritiformis]
MNKRLTDEERSWLKSSIEKFLWVYGDGYVDESYRLEYLLESEQAAWKEVERLRKMYEREREIAESAQKNAEYWKEYGENELRTTYTLIFNLQKKENLLTHAIQSLESIRDHSTDKDSARAASEAVKLIKRIQEGNGNE